MKPANDELADELAANIIDAKFGTARCAMLMTGPLSNGKRYIVQEFRENEEMERHEALLKRGKAWGEKASAAEIVRLRATREEIVREIAEEMKHVVHGAIFSVMMKVENPAPCHYSEAALDAIDALIDKQE
jgi:hypothetical protein